MNTMDIARLCESLSLSDEDGEVVKVSGSESAEGVRETAHCLVGKILGRKRVNRQAFKIVIDQLWSTIQEVKIEVVGDNIFVFRFKSREDKATVWSRGPWHFDRSLIVLVEPQGPGEISQMKFNQVIFWIQLWNLPLMCMNRLVARLLAGMVGEFIELPQDSSDCLGKFMRVRVKVDIPKPLRRGLRVYLEDFDTMVTTLIRYERLPKFCFGCSLVGHSVRECMREGPSSGRDNQPKYGDWLRASVIERQKVQFQRAGSPTRTERSSDGDKEGMSRGIVRRDREIDKDKGVGNQKDSASMILRERRKEGVQKEWQEKEGESATQEKSNRTLRVAAEVLTGEGGSGVKGITTKVSNSKLNNQEGDVTLFIMSPGKATEPDVMDC